jgi:hypothetical protein
MVLKVSSAEWFCAVVSWNREDLEFQSVENQIIPCYTSLYAKFSGWSLSWRLYGVDMQRLREPGPQASADEWSILTVVARARKAVVVGFSTVFMWFDIQCKIRLQTVTLELNKIHIKLRLSYQQSPIEINSKQYIKRQITTLPLILFDITKLPLTFYTIYYITPVKIEAIR